MKKEKFTYTGNAARMPGAKIVVAFNGMYLSTWNYTGNPAWKFTISAGKVYPVRIVYHLNSAGTKWLIDSLEVVEA